MTTFRLFPATNGPSAASGYSGPFQAGMIFKVTSDAQWLDGYWWWCCNTGQQTTAVTAALWEVVTTPLQVLVPNSSVTSGTLTPGTWNYIPLPAPIALGKGLSYVAVVGFQSTTGFPETVSQFGSGQPFAAGIVNGPLTAYSDVSGSNPAPASQTQGLFGVGSASGANANANYPSSGSSGSSNFWVDVQIDSIAPGGASYQIWPSQPYPINYGLDTANNFTLGTEFTLSAACALNEILFYSPATVTQLPTECGIWLVSNQTLVPGTHLTSPSWSGAAGSGWVSVSYSGVTLPAGDYKASVFNGAGSPAIWNAQTAPYWESPGAGTAGIVNGPVSAPNNASATAPGQSTFHLGTPFSWPDTHAPGIGSATYWVDVLVTPTAFSGTGTATAALTATTSTGIARLTGERQLVRKAVAGYFGGSLVTTDAGTCYQGGPLTAYGLGTAYPYTVRGVPDEYYTQGQPDGQNWGMVMSTTRLERVTARDSYGGATSGFRSRRYAVECEIALICELPHIEVAGAALDDLIDAMFGLLAVDRNLGTKAAYNAGTSLLLIIQAGEGKGGQGGPGFRDLTEKFQEIDAEKGRYAALATVSFEAFTMVAS